MKPDLFLLHLFLDHFLSLLAHFASPSLLLFLGLSNGDVLHHCCLIGGPFFFDASICLCIEPLVEPADPLILPAFLSVEYVLRQMPMVGYPAYFVAVDVLVNEFLPVLYRSFLSLADHTGRSPGHALPQSYVHVLRPCLTNQLPESMQWESTVYVTLVTICIRFVWQTSLLRPESKGKMRSVRSNEPLTNYRPVGAQSMSVTAPM